MEREVITDLENVVWIRVALGSKVRPMRKADNFAIICEPIV
jgi:hypothetical protein